jgi:hypothetical protein
VISSAQTPPAPDRIVRIARQVWHLQLIARLDFLQKISALLSANDSGEYQNIEVASQAIREEVEWDQPQTRS